MIHLTRTDSGNADFIQLVKQLDADLAERDGSDHAFYDLFNKIDNLKHAVVAYNNGQPVACGAMKPLDGVTMEIKRMFTMAGSRKNGIAGKVLTELETWASELSFEKSVLETGKRQPEAIRLYSNKGYRVIPNYGQYAGVENSVCFEKLL
jgi:putative acetyltransferase